jgi:hypothetical protein
LDSTASNKNSSDPADKLEEGGEQPFDPAPQNQNLDRHIGDQRSSRIADKQSKQMPSKQSKHQRGVTEKYTDEYTFFETSFLIDRFEIKFPSHVKVLGEDILGRVCLGWVR